MAKQSISLVIAGKSYSLNIDREKEEVYRLAVREVNRYTSEYEQHRIKGFEARDYLAMAAMQLAIDNINTKMGMELGSDDITNIEKINQQIESYLNDIEREK